MILGIEQYGFRTNSVTENASYKLINGILLTMDNKLTVSGIFCDLERSTVSVITFYYLN